MRQNTQVISKGFNILSTRFNKLSSDQDELSLKLDKKFVLVEEGIIRMQKVIISSLHVSFFDNLVGNCAIFLLRKPCNILLHC